MQSILLFLLAAPVYPILLSTQFDPEIQSSDIAFVTLDIALVVWEIFADQQQWSKSSHWNSNRRCMLMKSPS